MTFISMFLGPMDILVREYIFFKIHAYLLEILIAGMYGPDLIRNIEGDSLCSRGIKIKDLRPVSDVVTWLQREIWRLCS